MKGGGKEDRWALVTGASSGIGAEMARELAGRGWNLVLTARSGDALRSLGAELEAGTGVQVRVVPADLNESRGPALLEEATEGRGVPVDLLVNNAGLGDFRPFLEGERERNLRIVQVNVAALTDLSWRFAARMAGRGGGRILNVASTAAFQPGPGMAVYYASKAYVLSLSEALRVEFRRHGISVTTLCPGPTRSGFQSAAGMQGSGVFRFLPVPGSREVARFGVDQALRGRGVVVHGRVNRILATLVRFPPRGWVPDLVHRIQRARG